MALGYLVPTVLIGICIAAALWPRQLSRAAGSAPFFLGMVVSEQPFLPAYLLAVSAALSIAQGTVESVTGWIAVALTALDFAGLTVILRRALHARAALGDQLAETLGEGWRGEIERPQRITMARWLRLLVIPLWRRRRGVLRRRNISYGDAGRWHLLDVYEPRTAGANRPVFIHFHGGHFASGHKSREAASLLYRLASHGWVCVSANYRLRAASAFPNALIDAKRVVAWVRDHADELGADPEMLVVSGSSAGAHLAAGLALTPNQARYQPGFASSETSVAGAVGFYGYYGPVSASPDSSPVHDIGPHAPPFLVLDAGQDSYVPVNGGRSFADALRSASERPVGYAELPGAQHAFDLYDSVRFDAVSDAVEAFVDTLRTDSRSGLLTDSPDRRT